MSDRTRISWSDASWNPVSGCTEVSPGCAHCYAKEFAERFRGVAGNYYEHGFDLQLRPSQMGKPFHWQRPRRIFVNSMSDLFHEEVPNEYIDEVFEIMKATPRHTYQLLTKRIERAVEYLNGYPGRRPLTNLFVGPTVENETMAKQRLPELQKLKMNGWRTMVSYEPALGPVDFSPWLGNRADAEMGWKDCLCSEIDPADRPCMTCLVRGNVIDWLICGGESGRERREFKHIWALAAMLHCKDRGIPFFMKQDGALRSEVYDTLPEDLKVRQFPT